jgi:hypothetical protein
MYGKIKNVPNHPPDILLFQLLTIIYHRLTIDIPSHGWFMAWFMALFDPPGLPEPILAKKPTKFTGLSTAYSWNSLL